MKNEGEPVSTEQTVTVSKKTYHMVLAGVVVLLVAVSFFGGYMLGSTTITGAVAANPAPTAQAQDQAPAAEQRVAVQFAGAPVLGNANAPLTVVEFSDFQCPFCSRAFEQSVTALEDEYVKTGKVQFYYKHFPLESIHPEAAPAAAAAECANEQGKFWEYHDKLFQNQATLSTAMYKQWAKDLGMNENQFNTCLDSKKYQSKVTSDFQDGLAAGVSGTPTFFIGTKETGFQILVGAQPYPVIKAAIDQMLA